jgi:integrase
MSIYKPKGRNTYIMDFTFKGQRVYETTGETDKRRAQRIHDKRLNDLKDGAAGLLKKKQQYYLGEAAKDWRDKPRRKPWSKSTESIVDGALRYLIEHEVVDADGKTRREGYFDPERLLADIDARDIAAYQRARLSAPRKLSNRTVNIEVGMLRKILIATGHWQRLKDEVHMLEEREDVGKALKAGQERLLLEECAASASRLLLPFVTLAIDTGARYDTIRTLQWGRVDLEQGRIVIGKDKTKAGTGRVVPLNARAVATLAEWAGQFPDRAPEHYVFPAERYKQTDSDGNFEVVGTDPTKPVGAIKSAWESAKRRTRWRCEACAEGWLDKREGCYVCQDCGAGCDGLPTGASEFRFHDLRHTAVSRMIEAGQPLPIIAKVVGWKLSTVVEMAERYGHFEEDAMRRAVESIGAPSAPSTRNVVQMPRHRARSVRMQSAAD